MTDFSPTVRISGVPVETKERDDPEAVLRKTIKLLYQETFDPYIVKFFNNYRVIDQYENAAPSVRFLEILAQIECKGEVGQFFHGEVIFAQRCLVTGVFEDCDLHNLGKKLQEYVDAHSRKAIEGSGFKGLTPAPFQRRVAFDGKPSVYDGFDEIDRALE